MKEASTLHPRIHLVEGDITTFDGDAIVNAANNSLMGGSGVDGAIHSKGGASILEACQYIREHQYPEGLPSGKAVLTSSGNLQCQQVIHTVGPIWRGGSQGETEILAQSYANCLSLAKQTGIKTLAFPAISTGAYGFPPELAAPVVIQTIESFLNKNSLPREIFLYFFSPEALQTFKTTVLLPGRTI